MEFSTHVCLSQISSGVFFIIMLTFLVLLIVVEASFSIYCTFLMVSSVSRSQTGNGAGCLCYDRRERREAIPHDDDQEPPPDQRPPEEAHHRAQVLPWKVSLNVYVYVCVCFPCQKMERNCFTSCCNKTLNHKHHLS